MAVLDDAVALVCWFEEQPDCGTYKSDEAIAAHLGWTLGGARPPKMSSAKDRFGGGLLPPGDAGRVRRARRYVDRNNDHQPFLGYSFGTKRNGAGVKFLMLITPNGTNAAEAVDESASEQLGRAVQQANQAAAERSRMVDKLNEIECSLVAAGAYDKAMVIHDAAREIQVFGQPSMDTVRRARERGVLRHIQSV